jgi:hypothetical protein
MAYKKINLELIVFADDAEAVVVELNAALRHTVAAGETAVEALRLAREKVTGAFRQII